MTNERELIRRIKAGDSESFNRLYDMYVSDLYFFIFRYVKSSSATEDIIQEAFIKLWMKRAQLDENKSIRSYLFTICWHNFLKEIKKTARNVLIGDYLELTQDFIATDSSKYDLDLYIKTITEIKRTLPPRQKEIFSLIKENGKSVKEVAEMLEIQEQVVRNQLSAIMKKIRERIVKIR